MAEVFDPYLRWLGIRDPQRPPNHYRLLGLELFENDPDVIAVAADRQMAHLRTFQTGENADLSQRLLNQLSAARVCLLKPDRKAAYDEQLKRQTAGKSKVAGAGSPATASAKPNAAAPAQATAAAAQRGPSPFSESAEKKGTVPLSDSTPALELDVERWRVAPRAATVRKSSRASKSSKSLLWIAMPVAALAVAVGIAVYVANSGGESSGTDEGHGRVAANDRQNGPGASGHGPVDKGPVDKGPADNGHGSTNPSPPTPHPSPVIPTPSPVTPGPPAHSDNSPPEVTPEPPHPPLPSPADVIRVVNPPQPEHDPATGPDLSHQVAKVDTSPKPNVPGHGQPKTTPPAGDDAGSAKSKRTPVPAKEELAAAEAKIQKLFNVSAAKKPDERAALAKTLYDQGIDASNGPVDRYVLLDTAMKDAALLGDADLATKAADKIAATYDVNRFDEMVGILTTLSKTVRSADEAQLVLNAAQDQLDSALAGDDFDAAKRLGLLAAGMAVKSGNAAVARQYRQRTEELELVRKEYAKAAPSRETLRSSPDDPDANYTWGYYLGPTKGDFARGLPYLAKGGERPATALAQKELENPTDPKRQTALADGWLGLSSGEHDPVRSQLRDHAAWWYSKAVANLTGLEKKRVAEQLAQLESSASTSAVNGRNFVKFLTSGRWTINWAANPNATVPYARQPVTYKQMVFLPDGRCKNDYNEGTWTQDGPTSVMVRYRDQPTVLQHYVMHIQGQLESEHYDPTDKQQQRGVGTKTGANSN